MIRSVARLCDGDDQREVEPQSQGDLQGRKVEQIDNEDIGGYNPIPLVLMNAVVTVIVFLCSKVLWDVNTPR
jgi:hypothetical protein